MKTATVTLKSISPYSQSRHHDTPKLEKEGADAYEKRTWQNRVHSNKETGNVFIPPMAFKNCLAEAAKFLSIQIPGKGKATYTKHFEAGVLCMEPLELDLAKVDVEGEWLFLNSDGVRGFGRRVMKCMPRIDEWAGQVTFYIGDETVTKEIFQQVLEQAGQFIGIGRFRPRNNGFYGRFTVEKIKWS